MIVSDGWANWLWLMPGGARDSALIVGDVRAPVASALQVEFTHVERLTMRALGDACDAGPSIAAADCVVAGANVLGAGARADAITLSTLRALVYDGGCLFIAGSNPGCRRRADHRSDAPTCLPLPRDIERLLARAGFRDVRRFYALPHHDVLHMLVPATRRATVAIEQWDHWRSARRRLTRCTIARVGLHRWMYPSLAYLAVA